MRSEASRNVGTAVGGESCVHFRVLRFHLFICSKRGAIRNLGETAVRLSERQCLSIARQTDRASNTAAEHLLVIRASKRRLHGRRRWHWLIDDELKSL